MKQLNSRFGEDVMLPGLTQHFHPFWFAGYGLFQLFGGKEGFGNYYNRSFRQPLKALYNE